MDNIFDDDSDIVESEQDKKKENFLAFGDYICLYSDEVKGYIFNDRIQTDGNSSLFVFNDQDVNFPHELRNLQTFTFQIINQNRYKLNKNYTRLVKDDCKDTKLLQTSKLAAEAETKDNELDQDRVLGKFIKYGDIIQLKHVFSSKFVHVSTIEASKFEKNKMLVKLKSNNDKAAQFRIMPRCRVKIETEKVEYTDEILFESVKINGGYFHVSQNYKIDSFLKCHEINIGSDSSHLSPKLHYRPRKVENKILRGGSVVRFFHKDLEAYIQAEGIFDRPFTENVHLKVRTVNEFKTSTLYPSLSGIVYWQIESADSYINGQPLKWTQQVRLRHLTTGRYLMVTEEKNVNLTEDFHDQRNIFVLHSLTENCNTEEIYYDNNIRLENVVNGFWLHGDFYKRYDRKSLCNENKTNADAAADNNENNSLKKLRLNRGVMLSLCVTDSLQYTDAFVIQKVHLDDRIAFNYASALIPFLRHLNEERVRMMEMELTRQNSVVEKSTYTTSKCWSIDDSMKICDILGGVEGFLMDGGKEPVKKRQKLLRNLKIIDALVEFLKSDWENIDDWEYLSVVFINVYKILQLYSMGKSLKNSIYCIKYLNFIMTQHLHLEGQIGKEPCLVLINMFQNNYKIISRINHDEISHFVQILQSSKNYRMLELLGTLCVCNDKALTDNQNFIATLLFVENKSSMFHVETGQDIRQPLSDTLYISVDNRKTWIPLDKFLYKSNMYFNEDNYLFFLQQLTLYKQLCYGHNKKANEIITKSREFFTWDNALIGLKSEILPDSFRATLCSLLTDLFINIGESASILKMSSKNFVYDELTTDSRLASENFGISRDMDSEYPSLHTWLRGFFRYNQTLICSQIGRSRLIEEVLRLTNCLIIFGFLSSGMDIDELMEPVLCLVSGFNDKPFPPDKRNKYSRKQRAKVYEYQLYKRYNGNKYTDAIVAAKLQGLKLLEMLLKNQFNRKVNYFVAVFKNVEYKCSTNHSKDRYLNAVLNVEYTAEEIMRNKSLSGILLEMIETLEKRTDIILSKLPKILLDLTKYHSDDLLIKSLELLNVFYSTKMDIFQTISFAQILCNLESTRVHREVLSSVLKLNQLAKSTINEASAEETISILENYKILSHLHGQENACHRMGQNILVNNGILDIVKSIILQEINYDSPDSVHIEKTIVAGVRCMRFITQRNNNVQNYIFESLDEFLNYCVCPREFALMLTEVFNSQILLCLRIAPYQVHKIIKIAANEDKQAPEFLQLLTILMKDDTNGIVFKRNQRIIIKYLMENYKKSCYVLEWSKKRRLETAMGKYGEHHQSYFVCLIDLLAVCAEGEYHYIESLCQTMMSLTELINILNNRNVPLKLKGPFAKYISFSYIKTARTPIQSGIDDFNHNEKIWKHFHAICTLANRLNDYLLMKEGEFNGLNRRDSGGAIDGDSGDGVDSLSDLERNADEFYSYLSKGGFELIEAFFLQVYKKNESSNYEKAVLEKLVDIFQNVTNFFLTKATRPSHMNNLFACYNIILLRSGKDVEYIETFFKEHEFAFQLSLLEEQVNKLGYGEYNAQEGLLNQELMTFSKNCMAYIEGPNTLNAQLDVNDTTEYNQGDEIMWLPLGKEFQLHVDLFQRSGTTKGGPLHQYAQTQKLIQYLRITGQKYKKVAPKEILKLDLRCLQILRAMIYNQVILLPENWENNKKKYVKITNKINETQNILCEFQIIPCIMNLLYRQDKNIINEVIALTEMLLFNAARRTQIELQTFFNSSREENIFRILKSMIYNGYTIIKEKQAIQAQIKKKKEDRIAVESSRLNQSSTDQDEEIKKGMINLTRHDSLPKISFARCVLANKTIRNPNNTNTAAAATNQFDDEINPSKIQLPNNDSISSNNNLMEMELDKFREGGRIFLALRLLAGMCDGQFKPLQDYLRLQPDNITTENIVAEVMLALGVLYCRIGGETIVLVTQFVACLKEMCQGNQENRAVILNNKIVDFVNYILRMTEFEECLPEQVVQIHIEIGLLLQALIEESSPEAFILATNIYDTIDLHALKRILVQCYQLLQSEKPNYAIITGDTTPCSKLKHDKELDIQIENCGYIIYLVTARFFDIDTTISKSIYQEKEELVALSHFAASCKSIEIVKDDYIQKIHFRVTNLNLLRTDLKENIKWNIDRSSPSGKLRDMMMWIKDILTGIEHQEDLLNNKLLKYIAASSKYCHFFMIFFSLAINILMLVTWKADPMTGTASNDTDIVENNNTVTFSTIETTTIAQGPSNNLGTTKPLIVNIDNDLYDLIFLVLAILHNLFTFFWFISYFIVQYPKIPEIRFLSVKYEEESTKSSSVVDTSEKSSTKNAKEDESRLYVKLISGQTLLYVIFMATSILGTVQYGYCFATHLLLIIQGNQLLLGIIKAVTMNGISLFWVSILGLIIIYIFSLVAFAFFRTLFDTDEEVFCGTLAKCSLTVLRYGLVGNYDEKFVAQSSFQTFLNFIILTIFQAAFFIIFTTIFLNVIFGIIVDTFSELRDLKWTAEKDMKDTCFICSRPSYEFEKTKKGFAWHVKHDHNFWAYVYYFIYLNKTSQNDFTALDLYVDNMQKIDNLEFFPTNRALCLTSLDESGQKSKVDEVMQTVNDIRKTQLVEDIKDRREKERLKMLRWQQEYYEKLGRGRETSDEVDSSSVEYKDTPTDIDIDTVGESDV